MLYVFPDIIPKDLGTWTVPEDTITAHIFFTTVSPAQLGGFKLFSFNSRRYKESSDIFPTEFQPDVGACCCVWCFSQIFSHWSDVINLFLFLRDLATVHPARLEGSLCSSSVVDVIAEGYKPAVAMKGTDQTVCWFDSWLSFFYTPPP